jgi:trigger factor
MNLKTKNLPKNLIEIEAEISTDEFNGFEIKALSELAKEMKIPGFRPGKAPMDLIKSRIDEMKILELASEMAINENYPEIINQQKINPVGPPQIQVQKLATGNPFVFKLTIPLVPKVKVGDYKKIRLKADPPLAEKTKFISEQVEKTIKELQFMRRQEVLAGRESKVGDRIEVDLNLFNDNVPLEGGQIKNFSTILGKEDLYLPGLSENLLNLKAGEEKEFSFTYPSDHYDKKIAGRKIDFKVKVKNVYEINLPEINEEFAQAMGNFKNKQEIEEKIKENLIQEAENKQNQKTEAEILKQLVELSEFDEIPDILIEHETEKMINELRSAVENPDSGANFNDYLQSIKKTEEDLKKDFILQATQRVKTALIIREIALKEKIEVDEKEIEQEIEKIKQSYQNQDKILENIDSENGRIYLKNILTNQKTIDWLKNKIL